MLNPSDTIAILRDAQFVADSTSISDGEKATLLNSLLSSLPEAFNRPWIEATLTVVERLYEPYRPAPARPTEGQQDAAEMATGNGEGATEAAEGPTSGSKEQAKDGGRLAVGQHEFAIAAEAAAPVEGPKQGKTRK